MEQGEYDPEIVSAGRHHPTGVSHVRESLIHHGNVEIPRTGSEAVVARNL